MNNINNLNNIRKVINKYSNSDEDIKDYLFSDGEIVICPSKDNEGFYIKNDNGELVKIGNVDRSVVEELVNNVMIKSGLSKQQDLSVSQYEELITNGKVLLDDGTEIIYDENTYYMVFEDKTE
jgi:hypothetical protein